RSGAETERTAQLGTGDEDKISATFAPLRLCVETPKLMVRGSAAEAEFFLGFGQGQLVEFAGGLDDLVGGAEVELGEVPEGARAEAFDDGEALLFDQGAGAFLQGLAETLG